MSQQLNGRLRVRFVATLQLRDIYSMLRFADGDGPWDRTSCLILVLLCACYTQSVSSGLGMYDCDRCRDSV